MQEKCNSCRYTFYSHISFIRGTFNQYSFIKISICTIVHCVVWVCVCLCDVLFHSFKIWNFPTWCVVCLIEMLGCIMIHDEYHQQNMHQFMTHTHILLNWIEHHIRVYISILDNFPLLFPQFSIYNFNNCWHINICIFRSDVLQLNSINSIKLFT